MSKLLTGSVCIVQTDKLLGFCEYTLFLNFMPELHSKSWHIYHCAEILS